MKLFAKELNITRGFELLKQYVDLNANLNIYAYKNRAEGYCVKKESSGAIAINYSQDNTFYMAIKEVLIGEYGKECGNSVPRRGIMLDCARNAVVNLDTVKKFIVYIALLGYTYLELYVEDCLKIDGDEKFGYMRGAYSKDEIKELDTFAKLFGIELVPCIQTLAQYNQLLRRPESACILDKGDTLLIGEEKTYELLENIFKTVHECFSSRNINIGMDEAWEAGRGQYYERNGAADRHEIIVEHLNKVLKLCEKYSFKPTMWSDMIFRAAFNGKYYVKEGEFSQELLNNLPKGVNFLYWDYYHKDVETYDYMLKLHSQLGENLCFAGGIWTWRGYAPYNDYTEITMVPAIEACRKHKVHDIMMALWGDNGGECARFSTLSSLALIAENILFGKIDYERISKILVALTGYTYEELKKLDLANHLWGDKLGMNVNPCKYLLFADPFISFFDEYVQRGCSKTYKKSYKLLAELSKRESEFSYLFKTQASLCKVLSDKAELSIKLKEAYDAQDVAELGKLTMSLNRLIRNLEGFYKAYEHQWSIENKPFGFEVQDVRIGGLIMRLKHVQRRIRAYIAGECESIPELEEKRHSYALDKLWGDSTMFNNYALTITAGIL